MINKLTSFFKTEANLDLCSLARVGGYSADNYVATFSNEQKLFVKLLRENAKEYILKLQTIISILDKNIKIPFSKPIIINDKENIIVFPYVEGAVLHGVDITATHGRSIVVSLLNNFATLDPHGLAEHSSELFDDLYQNRNEMKRILADLKNNKNSKLITDILHLKQGLIEKYSKEQGLIDWIKSSNDFVHGDFHNENILFNDGSVVAGIDFELAHRGHLVEDPINFIWFAFLNSDFSVENLTRARDFLKLVRNDIVLTDADIVNGFKFLYIKLFSSSFIEKSLLNYGDDFYAGLLQRDLKKFKYIDENLSTITKQLLEQ